jgi:glucose/arabinose dehydrogenase
MLTTTFTKQIRLFRNLISVGFLVILLLGSGSVSAQIPVFTQPSISGAAPNPSKMLFQQVASGLTSPVFITNAGDGSGRIFIVERTGFIRILKNGALLGTPFLNISSSIKSGGEQGLLALAFHPSYSTNGIFFVAYTAPRSGDSTGSNLILQRFTVSSGNPDLADSGSGMILLTISHPTHSNHNGGTLAFGGDGYLYWSTGDGGSSGDPANNAQQLNNLLGKILRIDVNSGAPYEIPSTNPFYSSADPNIKKEIWAYGLRNPWRLSFDALTNDMYIGDVGQSAREEVNFQLAASPGGENYGWRVMEGSLCYNPSSGCDQSGKILPVSEYSHSLGCSITGGYVYRGSDFPSLYGYYFYGDYCSGRLFSLRKDATLGWQATQLLDTAYNISTFGEDEQGELYLADYSTGRLYQIGYDEDLIPPTVTSIVRTTPSPYNQQSVGFTVTFSEAVTGVDASDFSLTTSGLSGMSVSTISGSNSVYTVTVDTGSGNGTIRLDVVDDDTITDMALNPLAGSGAGNGNFNSGETYNINRNVTTTVGAVLKESYNIPNQTSALFTYAGFSGGPVQVVNTESQSVVTSLRLLYNNKTFSELMGLPTDQLSNDYWLPYYANISGTDTQIRFTNTDPTLSTTVNVYLGDNPSPVYTNTLLPETTDRINLPLGTKGGPVRIVGTPGVDILAGMRVIYGGNKSFDELMAFPTAQLDTEYWFPFYNHNNVNLDTQVRVANTSSTNSAPVDIYIGDTLMDTTTIAPLSAYLKSFPGVNGGPVRVVSTSGTPVPIVASLRLLYNNKTFSELMGVPTSQLSNDYWLPYYANISGTDTQIRFTNTHATLSTTVNIYLGNNPSPVYTKTLLPKTADRINLPSGTTGGPVHIVGTGGVNILAGMRVIYGGNSSFDELSAYPDALLSAEYWFPFYNHNNVNLDTEARIGVP